MKGFKNGSAKTVTKSGRNIKSQLGFTSHYFKTSSQSDISNLSIGPSTALTASESRISLLSLREQGVLVRHADYGVVYGIVSLDVRQIGEHDFLTADRSGFDRR